MSDLPFFVEGTEKDINHSKIEIIKNENPPGKVDPESLEFGKTFSAHMLEIDWTKGKGWSVPRIVPFHDFDIDPAALVLHYAPTCFEGLKAYKTANGEVTMFRPLDNTKRLLKSAKRLDFPDFDPEELLKCIKDLVWLDKDYIPDKKGYSMYIRPTVIGVEKCLGVRSSAKVKLYVICSPVGPYYKTGFKPVKLLACDEYSRATKGGTGWAKVGANYGITIYPNRFAYSKGCQQILWLYGKERYITEVGTMNFMCYWINEDGEKEVITASLEDGIILDGITRRSIISILEKKGIKVTQRFWKLEELIKAVKENRVIEAFGCGTAAIISPVEQIKYKDDSYDIPLGKDGVIGDLAKELLTTIQAIQYGEVESEWTVNLSKERE